MSTPTTPTAIRSQFVPPNPGTLPIPYWTYEQTTGLLRRNDVIIGAGYSGHNTGRMNPAAQTIRAIGPCPAGVWMIGLPFTHQTCGPMSMRLKAFHLALTDQDLQARDLTTFLIHGDSSTHPGMASDGCIVAAQPYRQQIAADVAARGEFKVPLFVVRDSMVTVLAQDFMPR